MKKTLSIMAALSLLLFAVGGVGAAEEKKAEAPAEAKKAEAPADKLAFPLSSIDGKAESAAKILRGKPTVLIFAQTACASCRDEMMALAPLYLKVKDKVAFAVVFVDMNASNEQLRKYLDDMGLPYQGYRDPKFEIAPKFGVSFTPVTVVLDSKGEQTASFRGFSPDLVEKVRKAIDDAK